MLVLLIYLGWRSRKQQDHRWIKEERYEESGDWLDKRASERGTYGSLDAERETDRQQLRREVKINQVAKIFEKNWATAGDEDGRNRKEIFKTTAKKFIELAEQTAAGITPDQPDKPENLPTPLQNLKKELLGFAYENYPALLDLEIETIKKFDRATGELARGVFEPQLFR